MITTARTILAPITLEDSQAVFSYRSDAETNKYQGWIPKTREEVDAFIAKNPKEFNLPDSWFQLVIHDRISEEVLGDIGIHFIDEHQCELGCTLALQHQGQGYAAEALKGVIQYLFSTLHKHRITGSIDPLNTASIQLMERLGFRKEAHFRKSLLINGEWVDDIIYALLAEEWK